MDVDVLDVLYGYYPGEYEWLKRFECTHFIDVFFNSISEHKLDDEISRVYHVITKKIKSHTNKEIHTNITTTNINQLDYLRQTKDTYNNSYILNLPHDVDGFDDFGKYPTRPVRLTQPTNIIKHINKRSICLYFNSELNGKPGAYGTSGLEIYIISKFLEKLIMDRKSRLFNQFYIVPRHPYRYPRILSKWMIDCSGEEWVRKTSLFCNTVHLQGMCIPGAETNAIPIIGMMCKLDNTQIMDYVDIPFFACGRELNGSNLMYNNTDKVFYQNKIYTHKQIISKLDLLNHAKNKTIYDICYFFFEAIQKLETIYLQ